MRRLLVLTAALLISAALAGPACAQVEVVINEFGHVEPPLVIFVEPFTVKGTGLFSLGNNFDAVLADVNISSEAFSGQITLYDPTSPPPGPKTMYNGDPLGWFLELTGSAPMLDFMLTDVDPLNDFAPGVASPLTFQLPSSYVIASATGVVDTTLPNLGYANGTTAESGGLFVDIFATFPLGVDLNGDTTNDSLSVDYLQLLFTDPGAFGAETAFFDWGPGLTGSLSGSVNPPFNLTELTVTTFSGTQEIVIPAVPEPSTLVLLLAGGVVALQLRRRARAL